MKNYTVSIVWYDPYPKTSNFRTEASNMSAGISRAVKQFRKLNKGRKIKKLIVTIEVL